MTVAVLLAGGDFVVEKIQDWRAPDPVAIELPIQLHHEEEIDRAEIERRLASASMPSRTSDPREHESLGKVTLKISLW